MQTKMPVDEGGKVAFVVYRTLAKQREQGHIVEVIWGGGGGGGGGGSRKKYHKPSRHVGSECFFCYLGQVLGSFPGGGKVKLL